MNKKHSSKGHNLVTKYGGTVILTRYTSSLPNTHFYKSQNGYRIMRFTRMKITQIKQKIKTKQSKGHNSERYTMRLYHFSQKKKHVNFDQRGLNTIRVGAKKEMCPFK